VKNGSLEWGVLHALLRRKRGFEKFCWRWAAGSETVGDGGIREEKGESTCRPSGGENEG
jgi:hypothetical protein